MHWLENWIMPPRCVITGEQGAGLDLSSAVITALKQPKSVCPQCCEFSADGKVCGACIAAPPAFDRTQVGFYFDGELIELVHKLKYGKQMALARLLAELLQSHLQVENIDALVAVPIHNQRWRERGFNQSALIAEQLAKQLNIPFIKHAVSRIKHTPSQTGLSKTQREQNLRGAFAIDANRLLGLQRIAIVDDVITTGSTVEAIAKLIKKQTSINYIEAWAVAKTQ